MEPDSPQGLHDLVHIEVTIVREGLDETGQGAGNIAEMDFGDLTAATEIGDHPEYVFAHPVAALQPRTGAESESPMRAAVGNLLGFAIALVVGEQLGDAVHFRDWRIVRVEGEHDAGRARRRQHGLHEVAVAGPDLVGRILAVEARLLNAAAEVIESKLAGAVATPDHSVGGVGVGRMEVIGGHRNAKRSQVAEEAAVRFDVLVAAGLAQLHARRTIGVVYARVYAHAEAGVALLLGAKPVARDLSFTELQTHPAQAELLEEEQVVVGDGSGVDAMRDPDVARVILVNGGSEGEGEAPASERSQSRRWHNIGIRYTTGLKSANPGVALYRGPMPPRLTCQEATEMRNLISGMLLLAALAGGTANAQYRDRYGSPYPNNRGPYPSESRYDNRFDAVRRAIADLDRAASVRYADRRDWRHAESARKDLIRFEESRARGRFDRGKLDGAINHLADLTRSPLLHPRERDMLARDIADLRELRYRAESWRR